jgi:hypothetical protein
MKRIEGRTLIAAQLLLWWFAGAQIAPCSAAQEVLRAGSGEQGAVLAVSPSVLDFGLVGVGRTKDLTLKVQNTGGGILEGAATVAGPFSIEGKSYALKNGQSRAFKVRYKPTAPGTNSESVVFSGASRATVLVTGWARIPPSPPGKLRIVKPARPLFAEAEQADFIVKYFSDQVSYMVKPPKVETLEEYRFQAFLSRHVVLKIADERSRRELAVVELMHYQGTGPEEAAKLGWINDLKGLRYKRLVFLRGDAKTMQANRLPVLADISLEPAPVSENPPAPALSVKQ